MFVAWKGTTNCISLYILAQTLNILALKNSEIQKTQYPDTGLQSMLASRQSLIWINFVLNLETSTKYTTKRTKNSIMENKPFSK